ncbi:hypothetical protein PRIPAC_91263 [Pristionchus pacificus]|uniref:Uncharacterized protein n=1 Tax=Pristionchus pacificus TaxID=54126 RepID=A0A2A6B690_PRIPA|nr:hypothetical protein PRIPAC_91263 [Pristionchus pacificus]|eukprot:PDM61400.1 hypothetical protein PRIPAC_50842 [Pristionchus pacificus]
MDFVSSENLKAADDVDATTAPAWSDKPADDNDKWVRRDASGNWKAVFLDIPHHSIFEEDITILPPRRRTAVNQKSTITAEKPKPTSKSSSGIQKKGAFAIEDGVKNAPPKKKSTKTLNNSDVSNGTEKSEGAPKRTGLRSQNKKETHK